MIEDAGVPVTTGKEAPHRRFRSCLVVLLVLLLVFGVCVVFVLNPMRDVARWSSGANDLYDPVTACLDYAKGHDGTFPPLDPEPGRLMFERNVMHEQYGVTGHTVTMEFDSGALFGWRDYETNPALNENADLINDHSWWYLGYVVRNDAEGLDFLRAYLHATLLENGFSEALLIPGSDRKLLRLHVLNDPNNGSSPNSDSAKTPVFVERPGHYRGYSGGWVAYLDGHIEYHDYPGPFPMSVGFIRILQAIDEVGESLTGR